MFLSHRIRTMLLCWYGCLALSMAHAVVGQSGNLCPYSEYMDENEEPVQEYFECPQPGDPADRIMCCDDQCCSDTVIDSVLKVDIRIAMIISLTVIILCVTSGVAIIICCFCPSCPMYDTCSGSWDKDTPDRTGMALPCGGDYMPAAEMHPATLSNGLNWETDLQKNHKLPDDSKESQDFALAAEHV